MYVRGMNDCGSLRRGLLEEDCGVEAPIAPAFSAGRAPVYREDISSEYDGPGDESAQNHRVHGAGVAEWNHQKPQSDYVRRARLRVRRPDHSGPFLPSLGDLMLAG